MVFGIKYPTKVDMPLKQRNQTKHLIKLKSLELTLFIDFISISLYVKLDEISKDYGIINHNT